MSHSFPHSSFGREHLGHIHFSAKDVSSMATQDIRYSRLEEVGDFLFGLSLSRYDGMRSGCAEDTLGVFLECALNTGAKKEEPPAWSCDVHFNIKLLGQVDGVPSIMLDGNHTFKSNGGGQKTLDGSPSRFRGFGSVCLGMWRKLTDESNGYVLDGKMLIEARFQVRRNYCSVLCDTPIELSDVVLVIEEQPILVNSAYLSMHSSFFKTLFYGNDVEVKFGSEFHLPDVSQEEFLHLLRVIYPEQNPISADTVEILLELANRYNIPVVLRKCSDFLRNASSSEMSKEARLLLAERFDLCMVYEEIVCSIIEEKKVPAEIVDRDLKMLLECRIRQRKSIKKARAVQKDNQCQIL